MDSSILEVLYTLQLKCNLVKIDKENDQCAVKNLVQEDSTHDINNKLHLINCKFCFYIRGAMQWTVALEGGPRRVNHAAVAIGDRIFSFGGYCSGETVDPDQPIDIHMLDTNTYRWVFVKAHPDIQEDESMEDDNMELSRSLPYQRYGHTVCAYRGRAYLWGGRNDDYGASSTLHEFDPVLLRWRIVPVEGRVPPARDGHSAVVVGDRMFLFGGFEEDLQRFSQETYVFDFLTNRWSELNTSLFIIDLEADEHPPAVAKGQPPLWRDFHTAVAIDSKMYIFGGRSDHTGQFHSTRDMYDERLKVLDLRTGEWSDPICSGVGPTGRRSHSAWTYGGKMYIFGGYLGTQNMHYDDLFSFDPLTNHWEKIKTSGQMPSARRRQCTVVVGSRVFLFGGTKPVKNTSGTPSGLADLADLYVLDYAPSLKHLAAGVVLRYNFHKIYADHIPRDLNRELWAMTTPNAISTPLTQRYDATG